MHSFLTHIVMNATAKSMGYSRVLVIIIAVLSISTGASWSAFAGANTGHDDAGLRATLELFSSEELTQRLTNRRNETIQTLHLASQNQVERVLEGISGNPWQKPNLRLRANRVLAGFSVREAERLNEMYISMAIPDSIAEFKTELESSARELSSLKNELDQIKPDINLRNRRTPPQAHPGFRGAVITIRTADQIREDISELLEKDMIRFLKVRDTAEVLLGFSLGKEPGHASERLVNQSRRTIPITKRALFKFITFIQQGAIFGGMKEDLNRYNVLADSMDLEFMQRQRLAAAVLRQRMQWISKAEKLLIKTHASATADALIEHIVNRRVIFACGLPLTE